MRNIIIPKGYTHNMEMTTEGVGSSNSKEYCKCDDCTNLRLRRDNIYKNKWIYKFFKNKK